MRAIFLAFLSVLPACLDTYTSTRVEPVCDAPYNSAPTPKTMECWSLPVLECPGWTWEACDGTRACKCYDDTCWCP